MPTDAPSRPGKARMYDLGNIEVALLDPKSHRRRMLKFALSELGITAIRESSDATAARANLEGHEPDLIIFDVDADSEPIYELARDIRHRRHGNNPFVIMIATTWHPDRDTVNSALGAGFDDIVMQPVSVQILMRRVNNLIENRKHFIVTPDYLGPDRREDRPISESEPPPLRVPNSLRAKATGDTSAAVHDLAIHKALEGIALQKAQRLSLEIVRSATFMKNAVDASAKGGVAADMMIQAAKLVDEIREYVEANELHNAIKIAASMRTVMDAILSAKSPTSQQFEVLRLHGQAAAAVLLDTDGSADQITAALEQATEVTKERANKTRSSHAVAAS